MSRLLALLALLLLASACTAVPEKTTVPLHGQVALDSAFSPEETEQVLAAAEQWRLATGLVAIDFVVTDSPESSAYAIVRRSGLDSYRGFTEQKSDSVLIEVWPADVYNSPGYETGTPDFGSVEYVLLHELGHAFGLPHQQQGLMLPGGLADAAGNRLPYPACIDAYTLDRFCELYTCPPTHPTCPE